MAGRFNTLYLGEPADVVNILETPNDGRPLHQHGVDHVQMASIDELRLALINAFSRIDQLETQLKQLRGRA